MNVALRRPMTLVEFLHWEERQELRFEFDGVRPVAMTGGTAEHDQITFGVRMALNGRLAANTCRVFGPNVKITVDGRSRYPDALVTCTPQRRGTTIIEAPVVIFEVLSAGSSRTDRIDKVREYLSIDSVRRYVILEADSIAAAVYLRDGARWVTSTLVDGDTLEMPEIDVAFPLAEAYAGVEFEDPGFPDLP